MHYVLSLQILLYVQEFHTFRVVVLTTLRTSNKCGDSFPSFLSHDCVTRSVNENIVFQIVFNDNVDLVNNCVDDCVRRSMVNGRWSPTIT
jgi:hypothetical protein